MKHPHTKHAVPVGRRALSSLEAGETGVIESIETSSYVAYKLMEMGLGQGETIRYIRKAPFGDPLEFEVMGCRLAIRRSEADMIYVRTTPSYIPSDSLF